MSTIRGKLETTISLSKATCYFLKTGRCSLNVVTDYYITPALPASPGDLLRRSYPDRPRRAAKGRGINGIKKAQTGRFALFYSSHQFSWSGYPTGDS